MKNIPYGPMLKDAIQSNSAHQPKIDEKVSPPSDGDDSEIGFSDDDGALVDSPVAAAAGSAQADTQPMDRIDDILTYAADYGFSHIEEINVDDRGRVELAVALQPPDVQPVPEPDRADGRHH